MQSNPYSLNVKDVIRGLFVALFGGIVLPVLAIIQTPGFDIFSANWGAILTVAINGGVAAFIGYIAKNFISDEKGRVITPFGRLG